MGVLRCYSAVAHAAAAAVRRASPPPLPRQRPDVLVGSELQGIRSSLLGLLGPAHPGLSEVARVFLPQPSHQLRALVVLLFAHATNGLGPSWPAKHAAAAQESNLDQLDTPLTSPDVLNNWHPSMPNHTPSFSTVFDLRPPGLYTPPPVPRPALVTPPSQLLPTQLRLAQIVEMIHIAAVLHDAVDADTDGFGNKLSILAGDFLLGRASAALSRLGEPEVVELIASVIANQAEGEVLGVLGSEGESDPWDVYLRRTYLKTASLLAKAARASVILGGCAGGDATTAVWKDVAYAYGRNIGVAYQLIEDTLEYTASDSTPRGLLTGPLLFASEEHPSLIPLIRRSLAGEDDVAQARDYVARSAAVERTRALAASYAEKAKEAIGLLPDSEHKDALDVLADCVVTREW